MQPVAGLPLVRLEAPERVSASDVKLGDHWRRVARAAQRGRGGGGAADLGGARRGWQGLAGDKSASGHHLLLMPRVACCREGTKQTLA